MDYDFKRIIVGSYLEAMAQSSSSALDGLPKQFVEAMRTLFDIMDDKRTGYVKFAEIENRWQDDGTQGLPKGVIDSLQKVTPPNGLLSFERFCAGLKICLLRNQGASTRVRSQKQSEGVISSHPIRPPSAPLLEVESKLSWTPSNTAMVRPNNVISQQRTLSMPQLLSERKENIKPDVCDLRNYASDAKLTVPNIKPPGMLYGPPKPPRSAPGLERPVQQMTAFERNVDKTEIRNALQNWQMGLMMNDYESAKCKPEKRTLCPGIDPKDMIHIGRSSGDGKSLGQLDEAPHTVKKLTTRRREPRRHTLQNGIDYNMLKRMKQIEQEKDILIQGLEAVERAKEWYIKQVSSVQEKMKYLGKMGSHMEHWTEAHQERRELQRARVLEVNRHLVTLMNSWERGGLPLHMNLAVHHSNFDANDILTRLKQQNHLLTEELKKKNERITMLEREKAALMRELFQSRSHIRREEEAAPFMS